MMVGNMMVYGGMESQSGWVKKYILMEKSRKVIGKKEDSLKEVSYIRVNFLLILLWVEPPEGYNESVANEKDLDDGKRNEVDDMNDPANVNLG